MKNEYLDKAREWAKESKVPDTVLPWILRFVTFVATLDEQAQWKSVEKPVEWKEIERLEYEDGVGWPFKEIIPKLNEVIRAINALSNK